MSSAMGKLNESKNIIYIRVGRYMHTYIYFFTVFGLQNKPQCINSPSRVLCSSSRWWRILLYSYTCTVYNALKAQCPLHQTYPIYRYLSLALPGHTQPINVWLQLNPRKPATPSWCVFTALDDAALSLSDSNASFHPPHLHKKNKPRLVLMKNFVHRIRIIKNKTPLYEGKK